MNPKDEITNSPDAKNAGKKEAVLPLLTPSTIDLKSSASDSAAKRSPVRFPALLMPQQDKVSRPKSTVAGILFLPSIL
ncbi:hypothetical protein JTE90_007471 [Oedothorax gibbosus]|uniref:Uncharacterized protein n=1 Tax=Oedothorax gibbosus TaxID=931172 RepID=A0AAV6U9J2_9ARAC|nr:hypothetical protein JTE90_007471 [Oedothorax gibbosus]